MSKGEVEAALEAVEELRTPIVVPIDPEKVELHRLPPEWSGIIIDHEARLPKPRRQTGTYRVHSVAGFVNAVNQHSTGDQVGMYIDEVRFHLVAILNDDGWRDHRVELQLAHTPEWDHWVQHAGFLTQEQFAAAIDAGEKEIVAPAAATMLTIAETFEAKIDVRFQAGANLRDGARELVYTENIDAKAGKDSLVIPDEMKLGVAPFLGGPAYEVTAKIRFKIRDGKLSIGYFLDRPRDVEHEAFLVTAGRVAAELTLEPIEGIAPPRIEPAAETSGT